MLLADKVALVTGSSGGLGRHIALSLAREGAHVGLVYHEHRAAAEALQQDIEAGGQQALVIQADVASEPEVERMVQAVLERFGTIDVLINNAGISLDGVSWKLPKEAWQQVLDVNLTGTFLCAKHVLPTMRARQWGRIVNVTSVVGQRGVPGTAAYAASKAGLIGLTKTLAREVATKHITVNALALGYFDAGLLRTVPEPVLAQLVKDIPVGRFGSMDELTWAIRFLCAPQASYMTGEVLNLNGGYYM